MRFVSGQKITGSLSKGTISSFFSVPPAKCFLFYAPVSVFWNGIESLQLFRGRPCLGWRTIVACCLVKMIAIQSWFSE